MDDSVFHTTGVASLLRLCPRFLPHLSSLELGIFAKQAVGAQGLQGRRVAMTTLFLQEEEALLSEMDVTGQAFEDMQEQNIRLMQQLREKDDANFKLMSERIKSNQIHKLLKEEKEELADQVLTLKTQVKAGGREVGGSGRPLSLPSPSFPARMWL